MSQPSSPPPDNSPQGASEQGATPPASLKPRGPDRRKNDLGSPTGLERRRGPGRRLADFVRAAEEGELTKEQFLFLMAIESFKKANGSPYPSWTAVLEVARLLGYRKTQPSELHLPNAEDWQESADAPAGVRSKEADIWKRAA
jgi:hypothetical protein